MGAGVNFGKIIAHFRDLQLRGTPWGYFQEPTKSILVVSPWNMASDEEFPWGMGLKVVKESGYFGVFIGNREVETTWLEEKVQGWTESARKLLGVDRKNPKSVYKGLQKSLQQEWELMQRVTPYI